MHFFSLYFAVQAFPGLQILSTGFGSLVVEPQPGTQQLTRGSQQFQRKVYACSFCSKMFPTPAKLRRHEIIHTGERPFKCQLCEKTFQQKVQLERHYKQFHPTVPM